MSKRGQPSVTDRQAGKNHRYRQQYFDRHNGIGVSKADPIRKKRRKKKPQKEES